MKHILTILLFAASPQAFATSATFTPVAISQVCHRIENTPHRDCHNSQRMLSSVTLDFVETSWPGEALAEWSYIRNGSGFLVSVAHFNNGKGGREYSVSIYAGTEEALKEERYDEMSIASTRFASNSPASRVSVLAPFTSSGPDSRVNSGMAVDDLEIRESSELRN